MLAKCILGPAKNHETADVHGEQSDFRSDRRVSGVEVGAARTLGSRTFPPYKGVKTLDI